MSTFYTRLILDVEALPRESSLSHHSVAEAADGITGIEMFRSGTYDIIFTDLGMPEISGWEVARQIKAIDPDITIILITGWGVELGKNELKQKMVDSVIAKPFQINQILEVVSEALKEKVSIPPVW